MAEYPNLLPRFLKYVKVNSRSDEHSDRFPSTEREENFQKKCNHERLRRTRS